MRSLKATFSFLSTLALVATTPLHAQTVVSGQVDEAIIVAEPAAMLGEAAGTLILLPNGASLPGSQLALACLQRPPAVTPLLVYRIQSRQCLAVADYASGPNSAGRIDLVFAALDEGRLGQFPFTLILPPGVRGLLTLEDWIFADGFE